VMPSAISFHPKLATVCEACFVIFSISTSIESAYAQH
jgi:hypothetical protein